MVLASESGLDGSRALREKGNVSTNVKSGEIWVVGADVVDDDWLVCEDIFVFGGHSAGGAKGGYVGGGVSWAHGTVQSREMRRVSPVLFLKSAIHDRETSYPLFPAILLNLSGAGRISRRSRLYDRYSRGDGHSSQRWPRSVISGRPQVSANVGTVTQKVSQAFLHSNSDDRYMLWNKVLDPPPRHPRQPFQAVSLLHKAMVSEPEPAHLRRGLSGRHGPRYGDG